MLNNMLLTEAGTLWLGSEVSYRAVIHAYQKMGEAGEDPYKKQCFYQDDEDEEEGGRHFLLDVVDNVAVIRVHGSLVSGSEGSWGAYWGVVGYDDIRNAVITAVNAGVESILFDFDTPGGAVKGIMELSDFIKSLDIDTTSFTGGMAASGGLWLATASDAFYAARMAEVGSLGVLAVTAEMTEMYKDLGIKLRVFKSTPLKAAGNPYEKLTAEAAEQIQKNIDETHQFFIREVSDNRGLTQDYVSENIANGKVWYAAEAHELNLIDGIKTFDEILLVLMKQTADNTNDFKQVQDTDMATRRKILTERQSAAIASGATVQAVLEEDKPGAKAEGEDEGETTSDETSSADNTDNTDNTDGAETSTEGDDTAGDEDTQASSSSPEKKVEESAVSILQTQISSLQGEMIDLKVELKEAEAKALALEATQDGLKKVTAAATQRHFVAVGSRPPALEGLLALDSSALLAQHASALSLVEQQYPAGGQVSVTVDDQEDDAVTVAAQRTNDILLKQARI